jgi:hypothetical protein
MRDRRGTGAPPGYRVAPVVVLAEVAPPDDPGTQLRGARRGLPVESMSVGALGRQAEPEGASWSQLAHRRAGLRSQEEQG